MGISFTGEDTLELDLIQVLTQGESQWTYRPDIKTEQGLWDNFFKLLEQNNVSRLQSVLLTDDEKVQIKSQLNFTSFYEAGVWLAGENGISQVHIQRSDASLGTVYLQVHNAREIAGGSSTYEVVHQIEREKQRGMDKDRRTDVTLLICGLPMIHIELKNKAHSLMEAFRQIKKYDLEQKFTGIFSTLQAFVVSNVTNTKYIAANEHTKLDPNFLTTWVDRKNVPVLNLNAFATQVLTIPMGHELVTDYKVMDAKRKALILLRPYQIHATKAVLEAVGQDKSGFVWHTTGSGKTLTSYKASKTILKRNSLDKVLFLVDRKDLDAQTTTDFQSYAESDTIDVGETKNVTNLIQTLLSNKREVIITTAQKLNHLLKRFDDTIKTLTPRQQKQRDKLRSLKLAFVVDECHRAVSSEQKRYVDRFFRQTVKLWYGFTGTPIFIPKKVKGDLEATTEQQYGDVLHEYTVKEAIHDKTVLPFHVEYMNTLSEDEIDRFIEERTRVEDPNDLTVIEKEERLKNEFFERDEHMLNVIDKILNNSVSKMGLGSKESYGAILTVSSIALAQRYYKLFKEVLSGNASVVLKDKVKRRQLDFPRIALTYSLSENDTASTLNQQLMKEALTDYNAYFKTNFTLETIDGYNLNLTERISRKRARYQDRKEQLDIVIVVDRLLTGFDAPSLSTLFIDRPAMPLHDLIQAFSRTNRIYKKKRANIVTFRTPELYKQTVKEAIEMYSAGASADDVLAPSWETTDKQFEKAVQTLLDVAVTPEDVYQLSDEKKKVFAKAYQRVDRLYNDLQVYHNYIDALEETYDGDVNALLEHEYTISLDHLESLSGAYSDVVEDLSKGPSQSEGSFDIEYELSTRYTEDIDYEYILSLMNKQSEEDLTSDEEKEIIAYIEKLEKENAVLGKMLRELWSKICVNPELLKGKTAMALLNAEKQHYVNGQIEQYAKDWLVDRDDMKYLVDHYDPKSKDHLGWRTVGDQIRDRYSSTHTYPVSEKLNRLVIKRVAQDTIYGLIKENILPLYSV